MTSGRWGRLSWEEWCWWEGWLEEDEWVWSRWVEEVEWWVGFEEGCVEEERFDDGWVWPCFLGNYKKIKFSVGN